MLWKVWLLWLNCLYLPTIKTCCSHNWFFIIGYLTSGTAVVQFGTLDRSALCHYDDVIMSAIASRITSSTIVYSTVYSGADQRKHENSASLAFVRGIHRGPVNSPHKWPVTRKMFPVDASSCWEWWQSRQWQCWWLDLWGENWIM